MRVTLDAQEVASVIINWGKSNYKTHNVSVERIHTNGSVDMLVTLSEEGFGDATSKLVEANYGKLDLAGRFSKEITADNSNITGPSLESSGL